MKISCRSVQYRGRGMWRLAWASSPGLQVLVVRFLPVVGDLPTVAPFRSGWVRQGESGDRDTYLPFWRSFSRLRDQPLRTLVRRMLTRYWNLNQTSPDRPWVDDVTRGKMKETSKGAQPRPEPATRGRNRRGKDTDKAASRFTPPPGIHSAGHRSLEDRTWAQRRIG